ncbi:MAG: prohibitin family protein [Flavobacteriales bacterium]
MAQQEYGIPELSKAGKFGAGGIIILLLVVIALWKSSVNIGYGEAGVLFKTLGDGVVTDKPPLDEGFQLIAPWNKVEKYNTKQQELFQKDMTVLSSNGLEINLDISVLYQPQLANLGKLHKTKGTNYVETVIAPQIRAVTRSVVGRYTPEQLYSTKRDAIQKEIYEEMKVELEIQYVQLNAVLVRNVTLPVKIKNYIEKKLGQEQETLEYEFRLEKAKKEAERQKIDAEGKAAANKILSASLTDKILKEKGIEATLQLSKSPNSKVVIVGGKDGMPLILGNN